MLLPGVKLMLRHNRSVLTLTALVLVLPLAAQVLALLLAATPAAADTIFDVEHARGTARAGGPVSAHDAEFLNRWGALSGTPGSRGRYSEDINDYDDVVILRRGYNFPHHRARKWRE
jgi:hypothetical protein